MIVLIELVDHAIFTLSYVCCILVPCTSGILPFMICVRAVHMIYNL